MEGLRFSPGLAVPQLQTRDKSGVLELHGVWLLLFIFGLTFGTSGDECPCIRAMLKEDVSVEMYERKDIVGGSGNS